MILIAHRGNVYGRYPNQENTEEYIKDALFAGYHVEVDLWGFEGKLYLGHDESEAIKDKRELPNILLSDPRVWKHAKNATALEKLGNMSYHQYFYHERDPYTLTSKGFPWIFPGEHLVAGGILCLKTGMKPLALKEDSRKLLGICSDYVADIKDMLNREELDPSDNQLMETNIKNMNKKDIEKLDSKYLTKVTTNPYTTQTLSEKINEIIDTVNRLEKK